MKRKKGLAMPNGLAMPVRLLCLAFILLLGFNAGAQQLTTTGKVKDAKTGEAIPGVSIVVKGTSTGVASDIDGNFSIKTSTPNAIITFSFVGYQTLELPLKGQKSLVVSLEPSNQKIDEVVVVGYGTQKKVNLTGAIASVSNKDIKDRPTDNVLKSIQGTVPGVTIISRPGGSISLNIRGKGSFAGDSKPMYIIDGIEVSESFFGKIDPNSIENISFLKDASSAAIYGAKAAYGVVLVSTKQSKSDKMQISFSGSWGFQKPTYTPKLVNSADYARLWNVAAKNGGASARWTDEQIKMFENGSNPDLYPNTNWFDLVLKDNAAFSKYSLQVMGGQKVKYFVNAGYNKTDDLKPGINTKIYNFNTKTSAELTKWFTLITDISYIQTEYKRDGGDPWMGEFLRVPTTQVAKHSNGTWGTVNGGKTIGGSESRANPLRMLQEGGRGNSNNRELVSSVTGMLNPLEGLKVYGKLGYKTTDFNDFSFTNKLPQLISFIEKTPLGGSEQKTNIMKVKSNQYSTKIADAWAEYEKTFKDKHYFKAMLGTHYESYAGKTLEVGRKNFLSNNIGAIGGGSDAPDDQEKTKGTFEEEAQLSYFGRLNYTFNNRYLLEFNLRKDASSRFHPDHRWGTFPSFSAGWRLNQEEFMQPLTWINDLKIRASWGKLGNIYNVGRYDYIQGYKAGGSTSIGGEIGSTIEEARLANPNLTWEKVTMTDIGFDFVVKNGLFGINFDYYHKVTNDILIRANDVSTETGVDVEKVPAKNLGELLNRGIEVAISHRNDINKDISYRIAANFTYNYNEIKDLGGIDALPPKDNLINQVGKPLSSYFVYEANGFWSVQDSINKKIIPFGSSTPRPGAIKFVDQNKDGKIDDADKVPLGSSEPKYTYGINVEVTYKNFTLSAVGQGVIGTKVYLDNEASQMFFDNSTPREWQLNYWTPTNQNASYPKPYLPKNSNYTYNNNPSSFWLFNSDYFRIKNITLAYNLPNSLLKKINMSNARVFISGENMFTFRADKRMKDFDPENETGRGFGALGLKIFTAGVSFNF